MCVALPLVLLAVSLIDQPRSSLSFLMYLGNVVIAINHPLCVNPRTPLDRSNISVVEVLDLLDIFWGK